MNNNLVAGILGIVEDKLCAFDVQTPFERFEDSDDPILKDFYDELGASLQVFLEKQNSELKIPAILVERDYKGEYERFALTPEEFAKEYPDTYKNFGPIEESNTDTLKPLVHIWFAPCFVGDAEWQRHFTDMEWGLPESDLENNNLAYVRADLMQSLKGYLPDVSPEKIAINQDNIRSLQMEISNLRHELDGTLSVDPAYAPYVEKVLFKRELQLDAALQGATLHEELLDAALGLDKGSAELTQTLAEQAYDVVEEILAMPKGDELFFMANILYTLQQDEAPLNKEECLALGQRILEASYCSDVPLLTAERIDAVRTLLYNGVNENRFPEFPAATPEQMKDILLNCDMDVFSEIVETVAVSNQAFYGPDNDWSLDAEGMRLKAAEVIRAGIKKPSLSDQIASAEEKAADNGKQLIPEKEPIR